MVATVKVNEITGSPAAYTVVDGIGENPDRVRLFSADQATANPAQTTNPAVIPSVGFYYSYWKAVCLDISGSGFIITNIRHYSAGDINWTFGSGGELRRGNRDSGDHGVPDASYEQATGSPAVTGNAIEDAVDGHTYYNGQTIPTADVNLDLAPDGATIDSGPHTVAEKSNHILLQAKIDTVANGAVQGTQTAKTLTWKYDES